MVKQTDQDIIKEALQRFDIASAAEDENRRLAIDDIKFVHDEDGQWTSEAKAARSGRPCMTFDHVSAALDQVLGDYLQSRPGIKVRAIDDNSDPEIADIYTGMIRNIESNSSADSAYNTAFKFAATCGYGVYRVITDYEDDCTFDQQISITRIPNPFTVLFDPAGQKTTKEDGAFCFVHESISVDDFKEQYPKANPESATEATLGNADEGWYSDKELRICEYWRKKPVMRTIVKLSDGRTVYEDDIEQIQDELASSGVTVMATREAQTYKVEWFKITASQILERGEWAGRYIPIIPVYGKTVNIEGRTKYRGLVRKAKDAQRSYNYHRSQTIEVIALQPKAPFKATPEMVKGYEKQWQNINTSNAPLLLFNPDPRFPGGSPSREQPPAFPAALMQEAMSSLEDIKAATGIHNAALGQQGNETSGRAIRERKLEADVANYEFFDNFTESLELTGRILVDLIPKIYDTERVVRLLGEDGAESYAKVNQTVIDSQTQQAFKVVDLSVGRYDVSVSTGPSYSTRRVETAEQLTAVMQANPNLGAVLSDLWVKSLDLVGGDEAIKRIRKMLLQQGVVDPTPEEQQEMAQQMQAQHAQQQAAQQMQMQAFELEMQQKAADVENTQADTLVKQAKVEETAAKNQREDYKTAFDTFARPY